MNIIRKIILTLCMCLSTSVSAGFLRTFGFSGFKDVTHSISKETAQQALNLGIECAKQNPVPTCLLGLAAVGLVGEEAFGLVKNYCDTRVNQIREDLKEQSVSDIHASKKLLPDNTSDYEAKKKAYEEASKNYNAACVSFWKSKEECHEIHSLQKQREIQISDLNKVAGWLSEEALNNRTYA